MVFSTSISSLKTTTTEVKNVCNWFGFFSKTHFSSSHIPDLIFAFYALGYIVWRFSMQILNTQVKLFKFLFPVLLQSLISCRNTSWFFLRGNYISGTQASYYYRICIFSALYEICHFNFQSECHTTHRFFKSKAEDIQRKHAKPHDPPLNIPVQWCVKQI